MADHGTTISAEPDDDEIRALVLRRTPLPWVREGAK